MALLRKEWPGKDFDTNMEAAKRGSELLFGEDFEGLNSIVDKSDRVVFDDPRIAKAMARYYLEHGRSHGLGDAMSDGDRLSIDGQIADARKSAQEAHAKGDFGGANRFSEEERQLIERRDGVRPIIGAEGRAA